MSRSKKIFAILSALFLVLLIYASYDISTRTTFPGAKPLLQERIKKQLSNPKRDSVGHDSTSTVQRQF